MVVSTQLMSPKSTSGHLLPNRKPAPHTGASGQASLLHRKLECVLVCGLCSIGRGVGQVGGVGGWWPAKNCSSDCFVGGAGESELMSP